ncbi:MAG TPA: hypothetical protein VII60_09275 [Acidimicrobiales bacterium]
MTDASRFDHLVAMTDRIGTFEHAEHTVPRREHGYCVDDVARVLVVSAREPRPNEAVRSLAQGSLAFISDSMGTRGDIRNRRDADGTWSSDWCTEDCWGRSLWGLGTAAASAQFSISGAAHTLFERSAVLRSQYPRSMAFAVLGAAAITQVDPTNAVALGLLRAAADVLPAANDNPAWPWPEERLWYANALLPDAMIATGAALERPELVDSGLSLLGWLLERETLDGHLSVTRAAGTGPNDVGPGFDQQPIEVSTMADACARAITVDDSRKWFEAIRMANAWFDGENDAHVIMWDPATGGGYDGLHPDVANQNEGAESTLALVSTRQQAFTHQTVST